VLGVSMSPAARDFRLPLLSAVLFFLFLPPIVSSTSTLRAAAPLQAQAQSSAGASPSQPAPGIQPAPAQKIKEYTLPPDLYRKARNRGRLGFASRLIALFYGLFVLWFILRRKLSAKFREWAEKVSRRRFL